MLGNVTEYTRPPVMEVECGDDGGEGELVLYLHARRPVLGLGCDG